LDKAQADLDKVKNLVRLKMKDVEVVVDTAGKECITNKANKKGQRTLRFSRTGG
jgi:ribosomal protein L31E